MKLQRASNTTALVASSEPRLQIMGAQAVLFSRRYRAALLDYLLGNGETGLSRAYDLGRAALDEGLGLMQIFQAHQKAIEAILEPKGDVKEILRRLKAAQAFLMETLSPFEMTYRGYVALLESDDASDRGRNRGRRKEGRHHR